MALAKRRLQWRLRVTLCHMVGAGYNIKIIESNAKSIHPKKQKTTKKKPLGMIYLPFLLVTPEIVRDIFATVLLSSPLHVSYVFLTK